MPQLTAQDVELVGHERKYMKRNCQPDPRRIHYSNHVAEFYVSEHNFSVLLLVKR